MHLIFGGSMKQYVKSPLFVFPTLLLFSGAALAIPLTLDCSTVTGATELSANIVCPQFNIGGGAVLSSIDVSVSGGISGIITLTNNGGALQTASGTTSSQFNFGALAGFSFLNPVIFPSFGTGLQDVAGGQTLTFNGLSSGVVTGTLGTNSSSFGAYTGAGTFDVPFSTLTGFSLVGGGGQISSGQSTTGTATAQVTYSYDFAVAVPEPTTISMLSLGLLALGFAVRKFQLRSKL
jgi:hypothetical protein